MTCLMHPECRKCSAAKDAEIAALRDKLRLAEAEDNALRRRALTAELERDEALISAAAWKVRAEDAEARAARYQEALETIHMRLEPGEGWGADECSIIISVARDALAPSPHADESKETP